MTTPDRNAMQMIVILCLNEMFIYGNNEVYNEMCGRFIDSSMFEELRKVGDGSDFRYHTVVLPDTSRNVLNFKEEAERTFKILSSKVSGVMDSPVRDKLLEICGLEHDILVSSETILNHSCDEPFCFILASAYTTIIRVNIELEKILDGSTEMIYNEDLETVELSNYDFELRSQLDHLDGLLASA